MFRRFIFKIKRIRRRVRRVKRSPSRFVRKFRTNSKGDYLKYKTEALYLTKARLEHFNQFYNFKYNKITIRNQVSRWGSCSKGRNLSFNFRIALLPKEIADYVIVHELCHLGEFNHSKAFWDLVE